jgi:hypothetical protein
VAYISSLNDATFASLVPVITVVDVDTHQQGVSSIAKMVDGRLM